MKKTEPIRIGDVLRECLEQSRMTGRLDESEACRRFPDVVGADIARLCGRPAMQKGLMTVKVGNAPLRQELNMQRGRIRELLNDALGKPTVEDIIFR